MAGEDLEDAVTRAGGIAAVVIPAGTLAAILVGEDSAVGEDTVAGEVAEDTAAGEVAEDGEDGEDVNYDHQRFHQNEPFNAIVNSIISKLSNSCQ